MPRTSEVNGHSHAFVPMQEDGKRLDDNATHAFGKTTLDGTRTSRFHDHNWSMWWDGDKKKFEVTFSPGGEDRHTHDDMTIDNF